jgi:uncharacterized membrane protein YjjP (DUF1212 family)
MNPETDRDRSNDEAAAFLLDLGYALDYVAVPANLVAERLEAAARGLRAQVRIFVLQGFLCVEVGQEVVGRVALRRTSFDTHWNLTRTTDLASLVRDLSAGTCSLREARARLDAIQRESPRYPATLVLASYAVYGGAVAARVGGRWIEMLVGAIVGLVAGELQFGTKHHHRIDLQKSFVAALAGTVVSLLLGLVLPPFDHARATFGGITLLVPAMVMTLATSEMANDALETGVVRLGYALLRFLMLGFGMTVAAKLWTLFAALPAPVHVTALPTPLKLVLVAAGGAALTVCMRARPRDLPWIAGAAAFAFGVQEATKLLFGERGSPLIAAFAVGVAGLWYARSSGRAAGTVIFPGLLQLAPGFIGTEAVVALLGRSGAHEQFFDVLLVALQLATGLLVAEALFTRKGEGTLSPSRAAA